MMGEQIGGQGRFFYDFNLAERIPQAHLLRQINEVLDLSDLRQQLASHYSHTGRPSIAPGADGADADHRLLLRDSFGAAVM